MDAYVARILPTQLCLSDAILIGSTDGPRWAAVTGVAREGRDVLVSCEGQPAPMRLVGHVAVRVRRLAEPVEPEDESALEEGIATWYPGDLRAAGSAVLQHAAADERPEGEGSAEEEISHYSGLYGGDLDHVVDALGGSPGDLSPADLRTEAFRRGAAARRVEAAEPDDEPDDSDEQMSGPYAGDRAPS